MNILSQNHPGVIREKYCNSVINPKYADGYRWVGYWKENSKVRTASFSISQYGDDLAFVLAAKSRELGRRVHEHELTIESIGKRRKGVLKRRVTSRGYANTYWIADWQNDLTRGMCWYSVDTLGDATAYKMAVLSRHLKRRVALEEIDAIKLLKRIEELK